jgi:hypothetical protein
MSFITDAQGYAIRQLPDDFPTVLRKARVDYQLFKAGLEAGLFQQTDDTKKIIKWFRSFPRYWEALRPNFEYTPSGTISTHRAAIVDEADSFVRELGTNPTIANSLAIAPLIIAGVLIAAVAGVAGAIWAIGYVKEQNNLSNIIDLTVRGKLPPEILAQAMKNAGERPGLTDNLTGMLKWGAVILIGATVLPTLIGAFKKRQYAQS